MPNWGCAERRSSLPPETAGLLVAFQTRMRDVIRRHSYPPFHQPVHCKFFLLPCIHGFMYLIFRLALRLSALPKGSTLRSPQSSPRAVSRTSSPGLPTKIVPSVLTCRNWATRMRVGTTLAGARTRTCPPKARTSPSTPAGRGMASPGRVPRVQRSPASSR